MANSLSRFKLSGEPKLVDTEIELIIIKPICQAYRKPDLDHHA